MEKIREFCETRGLKVLNYKSAGKYGQVFCVESLTTHLRYVAKVCRITKEYTEQNFLREASIQKRMYTTKFVVKLYEASIVTDNIFCVKANTFYCLFFFSV